MPKKILIVYATAGIGHKKAAIAVNKALDEKADKDVEFTIIDALDYTNPFFKWAYLKAYLIIVNKLPLIWGLAYYITDNFYINLIVAPIRRLNNWLNSGKLARYLLDTKPDVVISTHFFASEVISDMKRASLLKSRLVSVITDYMLHSWWVSEFIDTYVVAGQDAGDDLVRYNIPASKIKVIGIPAEPVFSRKLDKKVVRQKACLDAERFTVLVIGGGFGVGPIEDIIKTAGQVPGAQIIAICGHNEDLLRKLELLGPSLKASLKPLGFVDNVYEYMDAADILISKSGGITVTEALAKELPMIVVSPIIGQETRNCDYVTRHGAAIRLNRVSDIKGALEDMIAHPDKIERMRQAIRKIRKPTACYDIARMAVEYGD